MATTRSYKSLVSIITISNNRWLGNSKIPRLPIHRSKALRHFCVMRNLREIERAILDVENVEPVREVPIQNPRSELRSDEEGFGDLFT